jgi:hypothetical protein
MNDTLDGLGLSLALSMDEAGAWRQRIFAGAILSLASERPVKVSVQTTDGQYHYLEISTRISTATENESGGPDKASIP